MNCKLHFKPNSRSIFVVYIAIIIAVYMLPALKITIPYIYAALLMLAFIPIAIIKMQSNMKFYMGLFFVACLTASFYLINGIYGPIDTMNEVIRYLRFFLPVILTLYAFRFCSLKQQRNILIIFGTVMVFILIKTLIALENDIWIARILAQDKTTDTAEIHAYRMGNVGGFEFSYMMGIVVICLTWAAFRCKKVVAKIFSIAGAVVGFYYIIQTMYMTLLILTSVGILLLLLFNTKNVYVKILLVIGSIAVAFSLAPLCKYLSKVFSGSLLSTKFSQFYDVLTGGGTDSLGSRPELIMDAVQRWLKSPIWGGYETSVRTHSFVFSTLEAIGLIGLFAFLACMWGAYKLISSELRKKQVDTVLLSIVFLYVLALAVLNPIGYVFEVTIAAFFITPLWSALIANKDNSEMNYKYNKLVSKM